MALPLAYPTYVTDGNNRPSKSFQNLIDQIGVEIVSNAPTGPLITLSHEPPLNPAVDDIWIQTS